MTERHEPGPSRSSVKGWWHADTLHTWAQAAFDDELVTEDQFRKRLGCDAEEWTQMSSPAPEPFLSNPDPGGGQPK
ncbi:Uncharacterised protein [Mycobacteroides abscessus subsp. abscessus]|nr:Uncharacterised protein [Mycobacteroides abscessus subsp. abscessus]